MVKPVGNGPRVRIGRRISLREQIEVRKLANITENQEIFAQYRGRPLTLRLVSDEGHIIRAASLNLTEEQIQAFEARAARIDEAKSRVPELEPVQDLIELPADQIITIRKGTYKGLGSHEEGVPDHTVKLARDYRLFPLTIGFLSRFSSKELVEEILEGRYNKGERKYENADNELVAGLSMELALEVLKTINSSLLGQICLKLPAEPVLSIFFRQDQFKNALGRSGHLIITASPYDRDIRPEVTDIDVIGETGNAGHFVARFGYPDPGDGNKYKIGRCAHAPDDIGNCALLLEVVPKPEEPARPGDPKPTA